MNVSIPTNICYLQSRVLLETANHMDMLQNILRGLLIEKGIYELLLNMFNACLLSFQLNYHT